MSILRIWLILGIILQTVAAAEPAITSATPDTGTSSSDGVTSATALVISGTCDPLATVELLADASDPPTTVVGSAVVTGGTWTYSWTSGVAAPAVRFLRPRSTLLGIPTTASSSLRLYLDPVADAPVVMSVSAPPGATTGWTNEVRPTFAGSANPGSSVTVLSDGTPVASTTANAAGAWSVVSTRDLTSGSHLITATQTDLAGNGESPASASLNVRVDYVISEVVVYSATTGTTNDNTPGYTGKAEVGSTVELRSGSTSGPLLGSVTADAAGLWSLAPTGAQADGAYTYFVVSRDAAGNSKSAGPFNVTIDTVVVGTLDITGFIASPTDIPDGGTTPDRTVTVRGTITGAEPSVSIAVTVNGRGIGSAVIVGTDWTAVIPTTLNDALYLVNATASDPAGNSTGQTPAAFIVDGPDGDGQAFKPQLDAEIGGGLSLVTNDTTPTITGLARPGSVLTVNQTLPSASPATVTATGTGTFSFTPSPALADGTYTYTFSNGDGVSAVYTVTIDTRPPGPANAIQVATDTGVSAVDRITWDSSLVVSALGFSDPAPGAAPLTASLSLDGSTVASATVDGSGRADFDLTGRVLPDGVYTARVTARDAAGNTSTAYSQTFTVDRYTDPPLITGISPDTGRSASDGNSQVGASAVITGRAEPGATVQLTFTKGPTTKVLNATANGSGVFSTAPGALSGLALDDGGWTITPVATDTAGNTNLASHHPDLAGSRPSSGFSLQKDDTAPTVDADISEDRGPSASDNITNDDRLLVAGSTDALAQVVVTFTKAPLSYSRTVQASAGGVYSADFTDQALAPGVWTLTVQATDVAGNASTVVTQSVTVDTTAPSVSIANTISVDTFGNLDGVTSGTAVDRITSDTDVLVNGTVENSATVVLLVDGVQVGAASITGTTWLRQTGVMAVGARSIVARATDTAGNVANSAALAVTVDTAMANPTISNVTPSQGFVGGSGVGGIWTTNATTVAITGSGESASILHAAYKLASAGTWTELTTRSTSGGTTTWSGLDLSGLAPAGAVTTFDLRVNGVDHAGNASPGFGTATLVIDRTIPVSAPTVTLVVDDTTPGGAPWNGAPYNTDRYTRDNRVVVSGTDADAASGYVRVYVNGAAWGWVHVPVGGAWSLNLGAAPFNRVLPDGAVTITATNGDLAGNEGPVSAGYALTVDTRKPVAVISGMTSADTGRSATDRITQTAQPAFNGTVTDTGQDDSVVPLVTFTLKRGGTTVHTSTIASTDSVAALDTWIFTTPAAQPDGAYSLQVVAHDLAGNASSAVSTTFTIDRIAAVPAGLKLTSATDSGESNTDRVTNIRRPVVTGNAVEGLAYVRVSRGATLLGSATAATNGTWTVALSADLLEGANNLDVVQEDVAGNISAAGSLVVTLDTIPPGSASISSLTPATDSGSSNADALTNHPNPVVQGSCQNDSDRLLLTAVGPGHTTISLAIDLTLGDVAWQQVLTALPEGVWHITVVAVDQAGNQSPASTPAFEVTVDRKPPLIAISGVTPDSGTPGDHLTNAVRPTMSGTIGTDAVAMSLTVTGVGTMAPAFAAGAWLWLPGADLTDAAYPSSATATDAAGNVSAPATLTFTIDTVAPTQPAILAIDQDSGTAGDFVTNDPTLFFTGTAEALSRVELSQSGTLFGVATADGGGAFSLDFTAYPIPDGVYADISCVAFDAAGNASIPSASRTLTVSTGPVLGAPVFTSISTDSGVNGDWVTSDSTPVISGFAVPLGTVTLSLGGTVVGTATVDALGRWSLAIASPLADGTIAVTATHANLAGTVGVGVASRTLVVDTTIAAPVIASISVDSGRSASDEITNDTTLSISGTAEPLATVVVRSDGAVVGTATADATGLWVLGATPLLEGSHSLVASSADLAGNSASSAAFPVVIDLTAPPAATITTWGSDTGTVGDGVTSDRTLTLGGFAEALAIVTVRDGGAVLGSVTAAADGSWSYTTANRLDGVHQFTVAATDIAGNVSAASPATSITVDSTTVVPQITLMGPDSGRSSSDRITNAATITIQGTAEAGATTTVNDGATLVGTAVADAQGAWSLDASPAAGVLSLRATAVDPAGNSAGPGAAFAVTIDRTAPTAPTLVLPASPTSDSTPSISGVAEADATVEVLVGGSAVATVQADPTTGAWSWTPAVALPDAVYSFQVRATDVAGNTGSSSSAQPLEIDTNAPAVHILGISPDTGTPRDGITTSTRPVLFGVASPSTGVEITLGAQVSNTQSDASGVWTLQLPDDGSTDLASGTYAFTAVAHDGAGNVSLPSSYTMVVDAVAPAAPVIDVVTPSTFSASIYYVVTPTPAIGGGNGSAEAGSTVTLRIDGNVVGTAVADAVGAWTVQLTVPLAKGSHACVASASDLAGGVSADSASITVLVGVTTTPTITFVGEDTVPGTVAPWNGAPYTTDSHTRDNRVIVYGSGADSNAGYVFVYVDGVSRGWVATPAGGVWSVDLGSGFNVVLPDGSLTITARNVDAGGNLGVASPGYGLVVDTRKPVAAITGMSSADTGSSGSDRITSTAQPVFAGTVGDPGGSDDMEMPLLSYTLKRAGSIVHTSTAASTDSGAADDTWSFTTPAAQPDGVYSLEVVGSDLAGNESAMVSIGFTIDRVAATPSGLRLSAATDSGESSTDLVTSVRRPVVTGTAVETQSYVRIYRNTVAGALIGTATAAADGSWTVSLTADLAEGANTLAVVQEDIAGNVSSAGTLAVTLDTIAPASATVTGLTPATDSGSLNNDGLTNVADPVARGGCPADTDRLLVSAVGPGPTTISQTIDLTVGDTAWTQVLAALPAGVWQVTAVAVDRAGNQAVASAAYAVTVDRTPPLIAMNGLSAATDSGVAGDNLTNVLRPTLTGSIGTDAVSMSLTVTGVGTMTPVPAAGLWSWTSGADLADAPYPSSATATDAAGNVSAPVGLTFTVDATPPVKPAVDAVTDDSGTAGDFNTNDNTLLFSGTAEAHASVELRQGGDVFGVVTADATGHYVLDFTAYVIPDGTYAGITCVASDAAGNSSVPSDPRTLVVNTGVGLGPPLFTGLSTDSGIAGDWITNDATPLISGRAVPAATVTVRLNGNVLGTALVDGAGVWSLQVSSALADQVSTLTATQRDLAGNDGVGTASHAITIDTQIAAPVIGAINADTGRSPNDAITYDDTLSVSGTAEALATVTIRSDGSVIGTVKADVSGVWLLAAVPFLEGAHALTASARDIAGNSATSPAFPVTVDLTAPPAPLISSWADDTGTVGDGVTADRTPTLAGQAEASAIVAIRDGATVLGTVTAAGDGSWSYAVASRTDGVHAFTVGATDIAGNVGAWSAPTSITIDTITAVPQVTALSPDTGRSASDRITNAATITFRGTAETGATVTLLDGAATVGTAVADAQGGWSLVASPAAGVLSLTATAVDPAGNAAGPGTIFTATIDRTAPPAPTLVLPSSPTNNPRPLLSGTAEPAARIDVLVGSVVLATTLADATTGAWSWSPSSNLPDAVYSLRARATDIAGNTGTPSVAQSLEVDTNAPAVAILGVDPDTGTPADGVTSSTRPLLVGVASPDSFIEIRLGALLSTSRSDAVGIWTLQLPDDGSSDLTDGTFDFSAIAYDAAGNPSQVSTYRLVVDATVPTAPVIDLVLPSTFASGTYTTTVATPTIGGGNGTAEVGAVVTLRIDGAVAGTAVADASGAWSVVLVTPLAKGYHACQASAIDLAGNVSADSAAITLLVSLLPPPPVITSLDPDTGTPGDAITADKRPQFHGTSEAGSTVTVTIMAGATTVTSFTAVTDVHGLWTGQPPIDLPDASYTAEPVEVDIYGNVMAGAAFSFVIDAVSDHPAGQVLVLAGEVSANVVRVSIGGHAVRPVDGRYRLEIPVPPDLTELTIELRDAHGRITTGRIAVGTVPGAHQ